MRWRLRESDVPVFWTLAPLAWTLVWITFVLLRNFHPTGEVCCCGRARLLLPSAAFGSEDLRFAPVIELSPSGFTVEGEAVASTAALAEKLFDLRARARALGRPLESVNIAADASATFGTVKAALASAAAIGVRQADLAVWHAMDSSAPPASYP